MKTPTCYDCDQPLPTRDERKAGVSHTCVQKPISPDGWTAILEHTGGGVPGILGSWCCEIKDAAGNVVKGAIDSRAGCERLLRLQGFGRVAPTVAKKLHPKRQP